MKLITWNVNGLRAVERKGEIQKCIETYVPDIIFLQEIKGSADKFSEYLNTPDGYEAFYNPAEKAGYAGTGVWIKNEWRKYIHSIQTGFIGDPTANEGRVVHVIVEKDNQIFDFFGIYFPNGGKSQTAWDDKLVFFEKFLLRIDELKAMGHIVLWCGDINIAHTEIDLSNPKENDGKVGFHPNERKMLDIFVEHWWMDIFRQKYGNVTEVYSWWSPITKARERNIGWRIDAIWGDETLAKITQNIGYLHEQYGSDHCPMMIDLDI